MGMRLRHSCNFFNALLKKNNEVGALTFTSQDIQIDLDNSLLKLVKSIGFDQVQVSMDGLLEQNPREYVRTTMLRQEEIFKHQVHELHRLYRVQKTLMAELRIKEGTTPNEVTNTMNKYWSSTSTSETSHSSHVAPKLKPELNSLHRYNTVPQELKQKEELCADEECDVELSLSIGCSSSKKKAKNKGARAERSEECSSDRESLKRPPWLSQAMSLNRT